MKIYKGFDNIEKNDNSIVTIGTFDGVHKGHQLVIKNLLKIAKAENLRPILFTFDPHPQIVLNHNPEKPVKLLTSLNERIKLLTGFGVKNVVVIPFSREFSNISARDFVTDFIYNKTGVSKILIGYDHLFGKNREGDRDLLIELGNELGFSVENVDALGEENTIISSTKIRHALTEGNLEIANSYLGYKYFVDGTVVYGDRRGNMIGYPTANVQPQDPNKLIPANGVYLVKTSFGDKIKYGMANIGTRPTFTNNLARILEVFLFDFKDDIYGTDISVTFLKYIRDEKKFAGLEEFLKQLKNDEIYCRKIIPQFYI